MVQCKYNNLCVKSGIIVLSLVWVGVALLYINVCIEKYLRPEQLAHFCLKCLKVLILKTSAEENFCLFDHCTQFVSLGSAGNC